MTRVPEAGYKIIGLWISGLQRALTLSNLLFPVKVVVSFIRAMVILKQFKPHAVVGTGGYASGPIMLAATRLGIASVAQEQNSFAGMVNKRVANRVSKICVAYEGMEKYFPQHKIVLTGNPVRKDILAIASRREQALSQFGFEAGKRTLLVIGGSLGARTINESMLAGIEKLMDAQVQVIWQTGKGYYESIRTEANKHNLQAVRVVDFLKQMDLAYAAADVVISRSGALAVSELCIAGKPCILVPSPNVAEDHQTKNALALVQKQAALLVTDKDARDTLVDEAMKLLFDAHRAEQLRTNIAKLAKPNATREIVNEIEKLIGVNRN